MSGVQYYVVDTETTGINSKSHEIFEISIIRVKDKVQLTERIKVEYPERANYDALSITNKTLADLNIGKSKKEVFDKVNRFLEEDLLTPAHRCFIAHNASFDRRFIHAVYESMNMKCIVNNWLDTLSLAKEYAKTNNLVKVGTKQSYKLESVCELLDVKKAGLAHSAKIDTRNTFMIYKKIIDSGFDILSHIKNFPHQIEDDNEIDMSVLEDFE